MATITTSKRFSLDGNDFIKGLIMAVGGAAVTLALDSLNAGSFDFDWKKIVAGALTAGLTYLAKNFFDKPKVVMTGVTDKTIDAVKDGTANVEIQHQ